MEIAAELEKRHKEYKQEISETVTHKATSVLKKKQTNVLKISNTWKSKLK